MSRCSYFGIHISFIKLPPLVLLHPKNIDGMLLCIYSGKIIECNVSNVTVLLQVTGYTCKFFLVSRSHPFFDSFFQLYRAMFSLRNEGDEKSVLVS